MISKELSATLGLAVREAKKRRHKYVSTEHILFAILYDPIGIDIIEYCGGSVANLLDELNKLFDEKIERVPEGNEYVLQQTIGFQRVIQRAVNHARSAEKEEVEVADILASLFMEKDSHSEYLLSAEGVSRLDVLHYMSMKSPASDLREPAPERIEKKRSKKPTVFVSHVHEDAEITKRIKDWVEDRLLGAVDVFVSSDGSSIRGGDQWMQRVENALRDSKIVIILCTPSSIKRRWVFFEAGGAFFLGARVIPVCGGGLTRDDLEAPLSFLQAFHLDDSDHLRQLLAEIANYAGLRAPSADLSADVQWILTGEK
jgi:hypothetical protein